MRIELYQTSDRRRKSYSIGKVGRDEADTDGLKSLMLRMLWWQSSTCLIYTREPWSWQSLVSLKLFLRR
jgi:hypothetical protein